MDTAPTDLPTGMPASPPATSPPTCIPSPTAAHPEVGPLVITRGDGIFVEDDRAGATEGMSGLWCSALGFSHARVIEAGVRALRTLPYYHTFNHRSNPAAIELAQALLALAPVPMSKVFFANSGSEANDSAVKLVWYYHNASGRPAKKKIIARRRAYHGVTVAAASLSGLPANHRDFDLPIARILHVGCPHHYREALPGESEEAFATRPPRSWRRASSPKARHRRRLHRRAGDGRGRRDRAARHLLRQDPGRAAPPRRAADRRRGDLRLRPHRRHVRLVHLRPAPRHPHLRQGTVLRLPADLGGDGQRARARGHRRQQRAPRHLRPRLHLFGPPGGHRGGAGDPARLCRREHPGARGRGGAALPAGPARAGAAALGGRGARHRPDRRGGAGGGPRQWTALRADRQGRPALPSSRRKRA